MLKIRQSLDCTQRELVFDIAAKIYQAMGYKVLDVEDRLYYFERSQHPQEQAAWSAAQEIFEMFWGDSPDFSDEDDF